MTEIPLHGALMFDPYYWACDQPERPADDFTRYDFRCPRCVIGARAAIANHPAYADRTMGSMIGHGKHAGRSLPRHLTLKEQLERFDLRVGTGRATNVPEGA